MGSLVHRAFSGQRERIPPCPSLQQPEECQWDGSDWSHTGTEAQVFPHPPSTALRRLFPSADTPRDAFKSEIIVLKYISYTAPNCLPWQVSFCQHKGYAVSHSCHSTHNNTSGEMPLDKDRLLLPSNIRLGLFFSGMLKTFQTQQIKFLTNMMWNKNNKTTQRTPEL